MSAVPPHLAHVVSVSADLLDDSKYTRTTRAPLRGPTQLNDVYVTTRQNSHALLRRAKALLFHDKYVVAQTRSNCHGTQPIDIRLLICRVFDSLPEINLHAMGAAQSRVTALVQALTAAFGAHLAYETVTNSVTVVDDYAPLHDVRLLGATFEFVAISLTGVAD